MTGTAVTEQFDLVVGADGLRSTVRRLVFGPHADYLHRLDHIVGAFALSEPLPGLAPEDGVVLMEPGRAMWVFAFEGRPPAVFIGYRTDDVDAEFREAPAVRMRKAFGPEPTGKLLGAVLDQYERADQPLFDSAEQVRMDTWHKGRVVLVGDSAWCMTLYSGMGVSMGLAGAETLGAMLAAHEDIGVALREWEAKLRPFLAYHQKAGISQRLFFSPDCRREILTRKILFNKGLRWPVVGPFLRRARARGFAMKDFDIAA